MSDLKIKNNGDWTTPNMVYVKDNNVWHPAKKVFIKNNGTWTETYSVPTITSLSLNPVSVTNLSPYITVNEIASLNDVGDSVTMYGGPEGYLEFTFIPTNNVTNVSLDVNIYNYSMDGSGWYWYVVDNLGDDYLIKCISCTHADSFAVPSIFPDNCADTSYNSSGSDTQNNVFNLNVPTGIQSLKMAYFMNDNGTGGDYVRFYKINVSFST